MNHDPSPALPGVEHHTTAVAGTELHYVTAGTAGTPIVLVHGFPETWWTFHKLIPLLAADHHVIAVDLPGIGDSPVEDLDYSSALAAQALHELITDLDLGPVHLAGQDIAGNTVFRLAAMHPATQHFLSYLNVPPRSRLIHRAFYPFCTFAYAVTRQSAQRIVSEFSKEKEGGISAFDVQLLEACRDGWRCWSVVPELFHHGYAASEIFRVDKLYADSKSHLTSLMTHPSTSWIIRRIGVGGMACQQKEMGFLDG